MRYARLGFLSLTLAGLLAVPTAQAEKLLATCQGTLTYKHIEEDFGTLELSSEWTFEGLELRSMQEFDEEFIVAVHTMGPGRGAEVVRLPGCENYAFGDDVDLRCETLRWQGLGSWRGEYLIAQTSEWDPHFEIMVFDQSPNRQPFQTYTHFVGTCE